MSAHPALGFPKSRTALLLIDVINLFNFRGGRQAAARWLPAAHRIARLRERARHARVPVVYVNDNFGQWRSDFEAMVRTCSEPDRPGSAIARLLAPASDDFFVLKPTLSGFHETPLHLMLRTGNVESLILAGFAADICILFTAADAHMRAYHLLVPSDCVAAEDDRERVRALRRMERLFGARTPLSRGIRFSR